MIRRIRPRALVAALGALLTIVAVGACGGEERDETEATDGAFLVSMVEHHRGALRMAELGRERAQHAPLRRLSGEITAAQQEEIDRMETIHERLFDEPLGEIEHGSLGMAGHEMGMDMDMPHLESARRFDRAFIDMMIPHHQGAIRMARVQLAQGSEDDELRELSEAIVAAQSEEIERMDRWRERWYGRPFPGEALPLHGDRMPSHEMMDH
jgi:uncharacterized protein (DUF305 family)